MYESPVSMTIRRAIEDSKNAIESIVCNAAFEMGIEIDKGELLKALMYDRDQYNNGYADGKADATSKWISVEERLPELPDKDYCYVIVNTFLKGNANSAPMEYERTIIRGKREERWRWISGNLAYTPDFWMPLPEPPKEDTHG